MQRVRQQQGSEDYSSSMNPYDQIQKHSPIYKTLSKGLRQQRLDTSSSQHKPSKSRVNLFVYSSLDVETLKEENLSLKQQLNSLKAQLTEHKTLIASLQRIISTPEFKENTSTQKNINLGLQQQKNALSSKLKLAESQLNNLKKEARGINVNDLEEERDRYKKEVIRLRKMLVASFKGCTGVGPDENKYTDLSPEDFLDGEEREIPLRKTSTSLQKFRSTPKDSLRIVRAGHNQIPKKIVHSLLKEGKEDGRDQRDISKEQTQPKVPRVMFQDQAILPYNSEYEQYTKRIRKSMISRTLPPAKNKAIKNSFMF